MAHSVWTGGSRYTGQAALPHKNIQDVLHISNLKKRLEECGFSFSEFWSSQPIGIFKDIHNEAEKIKKKKA